MSALLEVEMLLHRYFDALHTSNAGLLGEVMHPRAIYATADETPLLHRTMGEYLPIVAARPSPASRGEPRADAIDSVEFAGANTALARVRCSIGDRDFVDFLSLVRVDSHWRIIAKVFQIVERSGRTV